MKSIKIAIKHFQYLFISLLIISCNSKKELDDVLWYTEAAEKWEEALPLGNGKLGVMVFGKPSNERFQLNDDSLWPADLVWEEPDGNKDDLAHI